MKNSFRKPGFNKSSKPHGKFGGRNGKPRKVRTPLFAPETAPILRPVRTFNNAVSTAAVTPVSKTLSNWRVFPKTDSRPAAPNKPFVPAYIRKAAAKNAEKSLAKGAGAGIQGLAMKPKKAPGKSPIPTKAPGEFPMRINKYLGWKGFATRRDADKLVEKRLVTINGKFAALGDKVEATDTVEVRKNKKYENYVYYAYNKPRGIVTDISRKGGVVDIMKSIHLKGVFPVGNLDANSEGLVILTNDRRITDRLLNPAHQHMKEYSVVTKGPIRPTFKEKMEAGVSIDKAAPIHCKVHIVRDNFFTLQLTDNGNQIRKMCNMFFTDVESLTRTGILNIRLERLAPNSYRLIQGEELATFLKSLGLS